MKKLMHCGLSVALLGFAGASQAQSSVTLYGIIDTGLTYANNAGGHSNFQQASGVVTGNRWGLLGSEDLGHGLKAIFNLENGFNLSNGKLAQNGREFGRNAFVGLSDSHLGTVTLGRQYLVNYVAPLSLNSTFSGGGVATHPYDNDNLDNYVRNDNAVKYQSANYGGLVFGAEYGFSNQAGGFANGRVYSVGASYASGGLTAAAGYFQINNGGTTTNPASAVANGDSTFNAARQRTWSAGANYSFGPAIVGLVFAQTQLAGATSISSTAAGTAGNLPLSDRSARFTNYELNTRYSFTPQFTLSGAYTFTDAHLDGVDPKYQQITVQADYALSKRTDVYVEGAFQHVGDVGHSGITARIMSVSASSTTSQVLATVGIRHRF